MKISFTVSDAACSDSSLVWWLASPKWGKEDGGEVDGEAEECQVTSLYSAQIRINDRSHQLLPFQIGNPQTAGLLTH